VHQLVNKDFDNIKTHGTTVKNKRVYFYQFSLQLVSLFDINLTVHRLYYELRNCILLLTPVIIHYGYYDVYSHDHAIWRTWLHILHVRVTRILFFYRRGIYFQNHAIPWTYNFRTVSWGKNEQEVIKYLRTNYSDGRNGCKAFNWRQVKFRNTKEWYGMCWFYLKKYLEVFNLNNLKECGKLFIIR